MSAILLPPVDNSTPSANDVLVGNGTQYVKTTLAANKFVARSSSGNVGAKDVSDAGLALIDDADAAAQRSTLALGTAAQKNTGTSGDAVPLLNAANNFSEQITVSKGGTTPALNVQVASGDAYLLARNGSTLMRTGNSGADILFFTNLFTSGSVHTITINDGCTIGGRVPGGTTTPYFRVAMFSGTISQLAFNTSLGLSMWQPSSTSTQREMFIATPTAIVNTDASRQYRITQSVYNFNGACVFLEADAPSSGTQASLALGGGTKFKSILSATATLDFGSISAGATAELTITVTGAAAGDSVHAGPPAALEAGLNVSAYVSASNTVTIRLHNTTGGSIDPASATWRATVVKF